MKTITKVGGGSAAVIACCVVFTPIWEGMDLVAKPDAIGTGHPITYCNGQTDEFGKVKAGQRFTPAQCNKLLAKSLPKYLNQIQPCIKVVLAVDTEGALLDAAYNAGGAAVCRSPMLAKMNAGDIKGGCEAFSTKDEKGNPNGWYIRSDGKVRTGLINRRNGEKELCLKGVNSKPVLTFWQKVRLFFLSLFKGN